MSPHTNDPFRASDELRNLREIVQEIVPQPGDIPELAGIDIYGATIPLNGVGGSDHVIYVDFKKRYDLDARIRRAIERDQPSIVDNLERCRKMAGVAVDDIWVFDASRQTKRVSANVSGFAGTRRIRLNDNLLNRSSMAEVEAVMGHEIGHYVLNHIYKSILFFSVVVAIGFALIKWAFQRVASVHGGAWGIRGPGDVAGLPLALVVISTYFFVMTAVLNSYIRVQEAEADLFGINASGHPDGQALVNLKLVEYRKPDPGAIEEILFFDHPSSRNRILVAMRWKAEHVAEAEAGARRAAGADRQRGWSPQSAAEWAREREPR